VTSVYIYGEIMVTTCMMQEMPVVPRVKAWVCGRSHAGITGSNPAGAWRSVSCEWCVIR